MDLELFVIDVLNDIQRAVAENSTYILVLTPQEAQELAELWRNAKGIEIY